MASGSSGAGRGGKAGKGKATAAAKRSSQRFITSAKGSKAGDFGAPF
jgi:hypothetical protein